MILLCPAEVAPMRIGGVAVPAVGDQAAVGLVLPHQRLALFSCQTVPLTKASSLTPEVVASTVELDPKSLPISKESGDLALVRWNDAGCTPKLQCRPTDISPHTP